MNKPAMKSTTRIAMRLPLLAAVITTLSACSMADTRPAEPDWLDGSAEAYPTSAWLVGLGSADSLAKARDPRRSREDIPGQHR